MKDEFNGAIADEFVGLKSKIYSIKKNYGKECNTAKGVSIAIEFNKFKNALFRKKNILHKMKRIQSKKYKLGTYKMNKISLSCFDSKRYVLDDGVRTLAYFHKDSVSSCNKKKRLKKIIMKKIVKRLKKIVIIEKVCDN